MRTFILMFAFALLSLGCQSATTLKPISQIPPSVAPEGSLANAKLISDTTEAIRKLEGKSAAEFNPEVLTFVIQAPVGQPGARAWREMWILDSGGHSRSYIIKFRETGPGAADFEIQKKAVSDS